MFYSGQKVICVDAGVRWPFAAWHPDVTILVEGRIYTIVKPEHTILDPDIENAKAVVVQVWEAKSPWGYAAKRFRPLEEKKTDISLFTELLNTIPKGTERVRENEVV